MRNQAGPNGSKIFKSHAELEALTFLSFQHRWASQIQAFV